MCDCVDSWLYLCILSITMSRLYCCCGPGWWGTIWRWLVWQVCKLVGCCSYFRLSSQIAEPGFPANLSWHKSLYCSIPQLSRRTSLTPLPLNPSWVLHSHFILSSLGSRIHLLSSGIFSGAITR